MFKILLLVVLALSLVAFGVAAFEQGGQDSTSAPPAERKIPGITADDPFPNSCVSCHINYVEMGMDTRFGTLMKRWNDAVEPSLVAKVKACAPSGITLKGKHPKVPKALEDVPAGCLKCHAKDSTTAPPFSCMIHVIHLTGGKENNFLTVFQGECTYCHKLDPSTGRWSMPSGPER